LLYGTVVKPLPTAVVREFIIDNTTTHILLLFFFNLWGEVRLSSVGMPATLDLLYQPWMADEWSIW
jgi:hypothetical protein